MNAEIVVHSVAACLAFSALTSKLCMVDALRPKLLVRRMLVVVTSTVISS